MDARVESVLTMVAGAVAVLVLVALVKRQPAGAGASRATGSMDAGALARFLATEGGSVAPQPAGVDAGSLAAFLAHEGGSMADQVPPLPF
jgi:hypothetical protein